VFSRVGVVSCLQPFKKERRGSFKKPNQLSNFRIGCDLNVIFEEDQSATSYAAPAAQVHGDAWQSELARALDDATLHLKNGSVVPAFGILGNDITGLWANAHAMGQLDRAEAIVRAHELFDIAHQDPYSHRAYTKPRGYAGDAVMMDYVYSGLAADGTTDLGKAVFAGTTRGSMGLSVLFRRQLLTAHINEVASSCSGFKILSVASGHCREIEGSLLASPALAKAGLLVAFDQDEESCASVMHDYAQYPIEVVCGSVRTLLSSEQASLGKYDLIYSAGLFDYLADPVAEKLVTTMAAMLKPGGKLLIGNFAPSSRGRGYMELFLDWKLIYRSEAELCKLFGANAASTTSFLDPHRNVAYAEWRCPG